MLHLVGPLGWQVALKAIAQNPFFGVGPQGLNPKHIINI